MLSIFQNDADRVAESIGEAFGTVVAAVLLIAAIVWLIKRSRRR